MNPSSSSIIRRWLTHRKPTSGMWLLLLLMMFLLCKPVIVEAQLLFSQCPRLLVVGTVATFLVLRNKDLPESQSAVVQRHEDVQGGLWGSQL